MHKRVKFLTIIWILSFLVGDLYADMSTGKPQFSIIEATDEIKQFVYSRLSEQYNGEIVAELLQKDSGIQLKNCNIPLDYSMPEHTLLGNRITIKVSCYGNNVWSVYVPVNIKVYQSVVTTNRPMSRDEIITAEAVSVKKIDITSLNQGFFTDSMMVIGNVMRFPAKAGNILTPQSITKQKLVKRGDRVNISLEDPELIVYMQGESLEDGGVGDKIKIKNISSKRIVEATIIAPGKVQVHI